MRATLRIILCLLSLALAAALVVASARPDAFDAATAYLKGPEGRPLMLAAAAVLAGIPSAIALGWWRAHRRAREISYVTEGGRVAVSLLAVEEALTRAVEGEACVKKAAVRVYEDRVKRQVIIDAVMTLWEVANVTERNRVCSQLLRHRFNELMPEQTAVQVNLTVHRLTPRREEHKRAAADAAAAVPLPQPAPEPAAGDRSASDFADRLASGAGDFPAGDPPPLLGARHDPIAAPGIAEDELYVGPSYPVEGDEDDPTDDYLGRPIPVKQGKKA